MISFFSNTSIKNKLLISYMGLIILPLFMLTLLTYTRSADVVERNMIEISNNTAVQISREISSKFQNVSKTIDIILYNNNVQNILSKSPKNYPVVEQMEDAKEIIDIATSFQKDGFVYKVRFYVNDEFIIAKDNSNFFSMSLIQNTEWYEKILPNNQGIHWMKPYSFQYRDSMEPQNIVTAIRPIYKINDFKQLIGIVCIDILDTTIIDIFNKDNVLENTTVLLIDENAEVLLSSELVKTENQFKGLGKYVLLQENKESIKKTNIGGQEFVVRFNALDKTGWKVGFIVPYSNIVNPGERLRNYTLLWTAVIGLIAYAFAYYISNSILKRFNMLIKSMNKAKSGQLDVTVHSNKKDEIRELEVNFNGMMHEIGKLMDDKYRMGKEIKSVELKALQSQINPHFLYNTLDLINWKANKYNAEDISSLVNSLAMFYKISLSNGRDIITVEEEIKHVKAYMDIQEIRYRNSIQLVFAIDESILDYSIMKLVLQPIVENAIQHGILATLNKSGTICISGTLEGDEILLTVRDDGIGMDKNKVDNILTEEHERDGHGYGLKNINERLKLNYGEKYGLRFKSEFGKGTLAEIRIPSIK